MPSSWKVSGSYFETCNCDVACPCIFLSPPTNGQCTAMLAWHIDQGHFGDTSLDGLNAVMIVYSPGHMMDGNWKVALYLDDKASQTQQDVSAQIFSGQAGGHLAALGPLIGEVLGVKAAPVEYRSEGKHRSVRLGNIGDAEITGLSGQNDGDVTVAGAPFVAVPGVTFVVAKSKQMRFNDHGLKWEVSDKNGFYAPFAYQSE
ncbi:MAG: DUF1326 domain-containing protein [Verrucomicrobia bacterium]|nr:DUF1326 domain-containing protein [Verrucomicrobiota bacterium]